MLLIPCPWCGNRAELEFQYGGEANLTRAPDPSAVSDDTWTDFLYMRANPKGPHAERWRHLHGCGRFFNVLRDTASDTILAAWKPGEPRPVTGETEPSETQQ